MCIFAPMNLRINHYAIFFVLLSMAFSAVFSSCGRNSSDADREVVESADSAVVAYPLCFCPDSLKLVEGKIKNGHYFTTLMTGLGMTQQQAYDLSFTDDSSVAEKASLKIDTIQGEKLNIKITTKEDLELGNAILLMRKS